MKKSSYNEVAMEILRKRHGYTAHYIRQCLRGDRTGIMPDRIKKEYRELDTAAKKAIEKVAQKQES